MLWLLLLWLIQSLRYLEAEGGKGSLVWSLLLLSPMCYVCLTVCVSEFFLPFFFSFFLFLRRGTVLERRDEEEDEEEILAAVGMMWGMRMHRMTKERVCVSVCEYILDFWCLLSVHPSLVP